MSSLREKRTNKKALTNKSKRYAFYCNMTRFKCIYVVICVM